MSEERARADEGARAAFERTAAGGKPTASAGAAGVNAAASGSSMASAGTAAGGEAASGGNAAQRTGARPRTRRRRRAPWRAAFFVLAAAAIIAGVGYALLGNRLFVVRSITVTGTHLVTQAQVRAAADVPVGTPLLRVDAGAVERRVASIRQVESAAVTKDWPDRLVIAVTERVPAVAVTMSGGGYDLVDPGGVIVRWAKAKPAALPVFLTSLAGSGLRGDPGVATAAAVLAELRPWLASSVVKVGVAQELTGEGSQLRESQVVTLYLRDHRMVRWGGTDRAALKNREIAILLRQSARYIDVSAPGVAVTK
jgi:cell division protein FtsQ